MSTLIKELIEGYLQQGLTVAQARSLAAQNIILSKIEKSIFVDKVLLKGGVVMYNLTQEKRRSTIDIDFDFIRYDIKNDKNIERFIEALNKEYPEYHIDIDGPIQSLHQQDYRGKRIRITIKDKSETIKFKLDIGVHTLLAIGQEKMCFSFSNGKELFLQVNPPEQIFAEKMFSLAKIGPTTQRFKDIDDLYYLINSKSLDKSVIRNCLELLTINHPYELRDVQDIIQKAGACLNDDFFIDNYKGNHGSWLDVDYYSAKDLILSFLYDL